MMVQVDVSHHARAVSGAETAAGDVEGHLVRPRTDVGHRYQGEIPVPVTVFIDGHLTSDPWTNTDATDGQRAELTLGGQPGSGGGVEATIITQINSKVTFKCSVPHARCDLCSVRLAVSIFHGFIQGHGIQQHGVMEALNKHIYLQ